MNDTGNNRSPNLRSLPTRLAIAGAVLRGGLRLLAGVGD